MRAAASVALRGDWRRRVPTGQCVGEREGGGGLTPFRAAMKAAPAGHSGELTAETPRRLSLGAAAAVGRSDWPGQCRRLERRPLGPTPLRPSPPCPACPASACRPQGRLPLPRSLPHGWTLLHLPLNSTDQRRPRRPVSCSLQHPRPSTSAEPQPFVCCRDASPADSAAAAAAFPALPLYRSSAP